MEQVAEILSLHRYGWSLSLGPIGTQLMNLQWKLVLRIRNQILPEPSCPSPTVMLAFPGMDKLTATDPTVPTNYLERALPMN